MTVKFGWPTSGPEGRFADIISRFRCRPPPKVLERRLGPMSERPEIPHFFPTPQQTRPPILKSPRSEGKRFMGSPQEFVKAPDMVLQ